VVGWRVFRSQPDGDGVTARATGTPAVAVIGGGAIGLSTAWHLVEAGITDVAVLEAGDSVAAGSSSRSAGFIESQYVDPLDIELRARSMHTFRRLQREHGLEIKEIGYANTSIEQLVRLKDHGVSAAYIKRMKERGYPDLTLDEYIRLRDRGERE